MKKGKKKMRQQTVWKYWTRNIDSCYGQVTYFEYLKFEADRICRDPDRRAEVRRKAGNYVALFVDEVEELNEKEEVRL